MLIEINLITKLLAFTIGTVMGSFLSALTYRLPREEDMIYDRSKCDVCGKKISWYDNIPLVSYILLWGKCRLCSNNISLRYPIIEFFTGLIFVFIFTYKGIGTDGTDLFLFIYYSVIALILIAIFVIDLEYRIIPDELVFTVILMTFLQLLVTSNDKIYTFLFAGFAVSLFLLLLNIVTLGRGMGLGDVKLAIFGGLFFGLPYSVVWLFLSFITGAVIGIVLVLSGKARFGKEIAFGPFLVMSFFLVFLWGDKFVKLLFPYLLH